MSAGFVCILKKICLPIIMSASFLFYKLFPKKKQDNKIEEMAEEVIFYSTGKRVDLSPDTPEDG